MELSTEVGEHVIYHWDDTEARLCGGTVPMVDRVLELIGGHYGWGPDDLGPGVEYFWHEELAVQACSSPWISNCESRLLNRPLVFSNKPIETHELAHASRGGHGRPIVGYPAFINEAFASRWNSGVIQRAGPGFATQPEFLSAAELRAALDVNDPTKVNYALALTWWVALESTYGPAKMAEFILALDGATSAKGVERVTRRVFGISLAESAAIAENLPESAFDDPACALEGLPTFTWSGLPLVLERSEPRCEDDDIINFAENSAGWLFALEFPDERTLYSVSVTVPSGTDPITQSIFLVPCEGELDAVYGPPYIVGGATDGEDPGRHQRPWLLGGRYVGHLDSMMDEAGDFVFSRVVFERVLDDADQPMP
ncbi:hypothetical protein DB30_06975 [Enhygromyxa salina]|uniref:Uncharacterized protein n=1 Tax=Enhygromyxa salina TaxID=215803 RepID=A0A0C2CST2_9BACT|nr:hypothetical protein [Enhygromyxa salina]KIG14226.1 hypothetical protein DB30_06975 [Enhygromyxa salina]